MNPKSFQYNHCRWSTGLLLLVPSSCANSARNDDTRTENPNTKLNATADENDGPTGESDAHGSVDRVEFALCTDFEEPHTDCDEVDDLDAIANETDPLAPDSNEDGLSDGEEDDRGSNPLNNDSDHDQISDGDDNCALIANTSQSDSDGVGDACDV